MHLPPESLPWKQRGIVTTLVRTQSIAPDRTARLWLYAGPLASCLRGLIPDLMAVVRKMLRLTVLVDVTAKLCIESMALRVSAQQQRSNAD